MINAVVPNLSSREMKVRKKNTSLNGIRTHDLCNAGGGGGALPTELSSQPGDLGKVQVTIWQIIYLICLYISDVKSMVFHIYSLRIKK